VDNPAELPDPIPVQTLDPIDTQGPDSSPPVVIPENSQVPLEEELPAPVGENNPEPDPTTESANPIEGQILEGADSTTGEAQPLSTLSEQEIDRPGYESQLAIADIGVAVQMLEEFQAMEFSNYLEVELFGETATPDEIAQTLYDLWQATGNKSALIYVSALADQLELVMIFPQNFRVAGGRSELVASTDLAQGMIERSTDVAVRETVPNVSREQLLEQVQNLRSELTNPRRRRSQSYLPIAQQLYQSLIAPMEAQLAANGIETLVFSMDSGLRTLPLGALHDGEQFLLEKYAVALVPSFGLTDVTYSDIRNRELLGMGSAIFDDLSPLPAVPTELQNIVTTFGRGNVFLNEQFTADNFRKVNQEKQYGIIHLATHAEFQGGSLNESYIKFFDSRVGLNQIQELATELGWNTSQNPPIELLTLSACRTAVGDQEAELGFAGLAVLSGAKASLASFWYVSDTGTLGLMSEFYSRLGSKPLKAEALRQTQLALLRGEVRIENGMLLLSNGTTVPLPPELVDQGNMTLSHPYFWSAFTVIGNWN
jgi:CHAT domain-containing protein